METYDSVFFTVLLSLVSIIIGGLITYNVAKWQMKRITIIHKGSRPIDIGKGLSSKFPNFYLVHNGNRIDEGFVQVIKGKISNISNKDLVKTTTNNELKLILPESCHVLDVFVDTNEDNKVDKQYEDNVISFLLPECFNRKESFEYIAILKGIEDTSFDISLKTTIPNIDFENQIFKPYHKKVNYLLYLMILFFLSGFSLLYYMNISFQNKTYKMIVEYIESTNINREEHADFTHRILAGLSSSPRSEVKYELIIFAVIIIISLIFFIFVIIKNRKNKEVI